MILGEGNDSMISGLHAEDFVESKEGARLRLDCPEGGDA